jgi:hypothetical protein
MDGRMDGWMSEVGEGSGPVPRTTTLHYTTLHYTTLHYALTAFDSDLSRIRSRKAALPRMLSR